MESLQDLKDAEVFISNALRQWYQCRSISLSPTMIIARINGAIVGTVALYLSVHDSLFPMEDIYDFDYQNMPLPFNRDRIVQFGRWIASAEGVSRALLYASAIAGIAKGCQYGLAEVKPKIAEVLSGIGVKLYFPSYRLRLDKIPEAIRPYYDLPPAPMPCMVDLEQKKGLLEGYISEKISEGQIIMDILRP